MLYCPNFFWNVLQVWMTGKDVYLQMTWSWPDKTWNILCSYCLQWNTSQSKFRNHYFLFLFAFSILSQLFLIWGCSSKQICGLILMLEDNRGLTFRWKSISVIMDYGPIFFNGLMLKKMMNFFLITHSFSLHKMLIDGLEWCRLLVHYCDVFISCLDSNSDGTHSLQSIHWWASDVMLNFSNLFWWRNKLICILDGLRLSIFPANFHFWMSYFSN